MGAEHIFGVLAVLVGMANWTTYLRSILRGQTTPHLFTWLIWSVTALIATVAQIEHGGGPGAWASIGALIFFAIVLVLCPRYGHLKATQGDWISLFSALAALPLWLLLDSPLAAVILVTIIDGLGFFPTIRKTWHQPYSEHLLSYFLGLIRLALTLLALDNFSLLTALYHGCFLVLVLLFLIMAGIRRLQLRPAPATGNPPT